MRVAAGGVKLSGVTLAGADVYWLETRPAEGGRAVLRRRDGDGRVEDVTPPGFSVRTRVHEYGGAPYALGDGVIIFSNDADQRLYRQRPGEAPHPITHEPATPRGERYADGVITPDGGWLICVRERHQDHGEPINELVAVATDGATPPRVIHTGHDFYSYPRLDRTGKRLTWTTWDHPRMPWDGTTLWVADLEEGAAPARVAAVAGGSEESILQPGFAPDGTLHFISDRTGWWNLYATVGETTRPLAPRDADFGGPQWVFGLAYYAFLSEGRLACVFHEEGRERLALWRLGSDRVEVLDVPFTTFGYGVAICSDGDDRLAFVGGSPTEAPAVVVLGVSDLRTDVVARSIEGDIDPADISVPVGIEFPTEGDRTAHALFYEPVSPNSRAPEGERPPLLVKSHGGPTSATSGELQLDIQYWTSRGFAVVDVNYGGSTGYGRAYRERLREAWGVVDLADCIAAARHLEQTGRVDGARLAIRGGSAGGYTTLCALVFSDVFAAGASYYGVADLELLARDTHKFESRYTDGLIGPYPQDVARYRERSPIHFADRISCPVVLFQGLEDRVVPPEQADILAGTLRERGLPFAYLTFEGEGHGFRASETVQRTLEAELSFYAQIFGFEPADDIESLKIENMR